MCVCVCVCVRHLFLSVYLCIKSNYIMTKKIVEISFRLVGSFCYFGLVWFGFMAYQPL